MSSDCCRFCARIDEWSMSHCYRCDVAVAVTGAEYRLCDSCERTLGVTQAALVPEAFWQIREEAAA